MTVNELNTINLPSADWLKISEMTINRRSAWLYGLDTTCGTLYFVEHENRSGELVEDYLGFANPDLALRAFNRAVNKLCKEMTK